MNPGDRVISPAGPGEYRGEFPEVITERGVIRTVWHAVVRLDDSGGDDFRNWIGPAIVLEPERKLTVSERRERENDP